MQIALKDKSEFKRLIAIKGYSQRGLSRTIGVSEPYVNQIANGERHPSPQVAKKY
ncbi:helix-turn-helix transcriptional regulator [Bacillus subtilis]|uniref:helix-turn-helix domain-containing protein n=1 Tax=Bacillus subtilis TaxID=1423 RepID=UPI001C2200B5|nr:helix-turn-helix transcriptional regulator [Bacillus subtilis]MBU8572167.1 helix-turn-helix transcriptional regulator [Bacillus subtilis]MBU8624989.1 helix-turn-helix transcriptional regulator [Bacillus subtilis]